jgi:hypothetical protein
VHVPKSGGTSIRAALAPFADGGSAASPDTTHETLPALLARHPELATHFKFAVVRNPWERLVSFFFHARQRLAPTFPQFQAMDGLEAMLRLIDRDVAWLCAMHAVRPQCDYICGEDGLRLTDFVGRHEHLDADFARACRHIGISAALPRMNVSGHDHYAGYYNDWCRDFVAARYGRDIGEFGYVFDRPDAANPDQARGESDLALVPRTRSSHTLRGESGCELRVQERH